MLSQSVVALNAVSISAASRAKVALMSRLCVFCGSSETVEIAFKQMAAELGRQLARRRIDLVYGGASIGLMGALADAVLENGGRAYGVMPESLARKEISHRGLTDAWHVSDLRERKRKLGELADGFVALPGGIGTFDELFEVLVLRWIGEQNKPIALLDCCDYYAPLMAVFDHGIARGFIAADGRPARFTDVSELLDFMEL
jgi:uncharacterized protein (TIGR00730 family)